MSDLSRIPGRWAPLVLALALAWPAVGTPRETTPAPAAAVPSAVRGTTPVPAANATVENARWLGRLAYGADPASLAEVARIGRAAYVQQQLGMPLADPPELAQRIAALKISQRSTEAGYAYARQQAQEYRELKKTDGEAKKTAKRALSKEADALASDARERHLLRAIYSPAQLRQVMTWFWLNHFSMYARKNDIRWTIGDFEEAVVRPHTFGKFEDLLMATVTSPAMLRYLDNTRSRAGKINENYARELMELHTLGVSGGPSGSSYTQTDVQELARILTGLRIAQGDKPGKAAKAGKRGKRNQESSSGQGTGYQRFGLVEFQPRLHDDGDKTLLGQRIEGSGFDEIRQAVSLLARQDATARNLSIKLASFFIGDNPPASVVDRLTSEYKRTGGDIGAMLKVVLLSRELEERLVRGPMEFKDPQQYVISSLRLFKDDLRLGDTDMVQRWLDDLDGKLYGRVTPDGYPMDDASWANSGQMVTRFEIAHAIATGATQVHGKGGAKPGGGDAATRQQAPTLNPQFYDRVIEPQLSRTTLATMAQAKSAVERNALLLSSPEWMQR